MAADDHAHDLPEGDLDGVGVLEHGQNKLGCDVMAEWLRSTVVMRQRRWK